MRKQLLLVAALGFITTACSHHDKECDENISHCNQDGSAIISCAGGMWTEIPCDATKNMYCATVNGEALCMNTSASHLQKCPHGLKSCHENGMVRYCLDDGTYAYMTCPVGQHCEAGSCTGSVTPPEGYVRRECGADGKSVVWIDAKGKRTTVSCRDEVGFDARCEVFGSGLAGCVMPKDCTDDFPDRGICAGNQRHWCDRLTKLYDVPIKEDCAAQGKICVMDGDDDFGFTAFCDDTCTESSGTSFSCTRDAGVEYITRCRHLGDQYDLQKRRAVCSDAMTAAKCSDGKVVTTTCADGEACVDGACLEICTAADEGKYHCNETSGMVVCTKQGDRYAYQSVGVAICDGGKLQTCIRESEEAPVEMVESDCSYTDSAGQRQQGTCGMISDIKGNRYACIEGSECGSLTLDGICKGNVVHYCELGARVAKSIDCSKTEKTKTCSVYKGIANCRQPCSVRGEAKCKLVDEKYMSYTLEICIPDDKTGALYIESGDGICLDGVLHSCQNDHLERRNCALNGGRCDVNACVYPACSLDSTPVCFADGAIAHCQVDYDGHTIGTSLETLACGIDGTCYSCVEGKLTKEE